MQIPHRTAREGGELSSTSQLRSARAQLREAVGEAVREVLVKEGTNTKQHASSARGVAVIRGPTGATKGLGVQPLRVGAP